MSEDPANLQQGTIVWASVLDRRGQPKERPVLIITESSEIDLDGPIVAVAVSTRYPDPPPADHIEIPWIRRGHPVTGLAKRSAAICSWLVEIHASDVIEVKGHISAKIIREIVDTVRRLNA